MVAKAGAGPRPIPHQELTVDLLAEALQYLVSQEAAIAAVGLASKMRSETGVQAAVRSFHKQLPLEHIQCQVIPTEPATWVYTKSKHPMRLSKVAAEILVSSAKVDVKELKMSVLCFVAPPQRPFLTCLAYRFQTKPIHIETTRWDPISGGASAVMATTTDLTGNVTGVFTKPVEEWRDDRRRKEAHRQRTLDSPNSSKASLKDNMDDGISTGSEKERQPNSMHLAGRMMSASATSLGNFVPSALNGMMVDIPLAITEGMRTMPRYYGGKVRDNGKVVDMKSGAVVAGKTFAWGFVDGLSDVVMEPWKGATEEGALGAVKGIGRGMGSLVTNTGAGMFGLFAYPGAGISKSIRAAVHVGTRKRVEKERRVEGKWLVERVRAESVDSVVIINAFTRLQKIS